MSLSATLFALLAMLVLLLALLLPAHVAAFVAWRRGSAFPRKWLFVLVCTLLSYGVASLVMVAFTPFQFVALQLAPQWGAEGFTLPSRLLGPIASTGDLVALVFGVLAAFFTPLRLRALWPSIVAGVR